MANRSRKTSLRTRLQRVTAIPITDPAKQAALDRIFRDEKITPADRELLLDRGEKKGAGRLRKR